MRSYLFICAALVMTAGCASDVANRYYGQERYSARLTEEVEILWAKPSRSFVVIADFQSRRESPKDMQRKAAEIGADAVIVSLLGGNYSTSEQWADKDRHRDSYSRIAGTAIRYVK